MTRSSLAVVATWPERHSRRYVTRCRRVASRYLGTPSVASALHELVRGEGYLLESPRELGSPPAPPLSVRPMLASYIGGNRGGAQRAAWSRHRPRLDHGSAKRPQPPRGSFAAMTRDADVDTDAALAELDALEPPKEFPRPGMEATTWREIAAHIDHLQRQMAEAERSGLSGWSRSEAMLLAARHSGEAADLLSDLARYLKDR